MDEHVALEAHHLHAVLVDAPGQDRDDPLGRPALGLALGKHRALGVERVAGEDGMGRLHLVPAKIGDDLGADRAHAHAGQKREGEGRVDQHLLPLRLGGVGRVEMDLLDIEGQQGEVGVVDVEHGAAGAMLEHVAGFEIFPVEARGFAIAAFADSFVGGQNGFHWTTPFSRSGLRNRFSVQAFSPAAARVRRALRAIASSIIWPSMVPTPLAFSARIARALSTASAPGVSAALIAAIWAGWMAALAAKPSATAAAISCFRPASSCRSKNGASIGVMLVRAQAAMSRPRAKASGAHAVADPRSAAMSAAPSIRPARRGVAAAIASTAARPRALSIKPISRVSLPAAVIRRSRIWRWPTVSVLGSTR